MHRSVRYTSSVAKKIDRWANGTKMTVPEKFSEKDPITVFKFVSSFQVVCGQNRVHEGAVLYCFQFFVIGKAKDQVIAKISHSLNPVDSQVLELLRT